MFLSDSCTYLRGKERKELVLVLWELYITLAETNRDASLDLLSPGKTSLIWGGNLPTFSSSQVWPYD